MSDPTPELSTDAQVLLDAAHEVNLDFDEENTTLIIALLRARADKMDANRRAVFKADNLDPNSFTHPVTFMNGYAFAAAELREIANELEAHS